jgi:hypothetical protein
MVVGGSHNDNEDLYHSTNEDVVDDQNGDGTSYPKGQDGELSLEQEMRELKRTKGKLCKNGCGKWVYLQEDVNGRWQPYNQEDNEFHRCSKRPSKYKCHNCGNNVTFDQDKVSKSGKPIPLNESDLLPHECSNDPFNTWR